MSHPPPRWTEFPRYPVVAGIAVLAAGATAAWWADVDISPLFESAEIRRGQLWRLLSSALPHTNILHLAFNVYWFWSFGTIVERVYGHAKTAGLIVLFALGSSAVDFAIAAGGVGLSGVVYGLSGLLWILSRRDDRFRDSMNERTVSLFVVWFFVCIATTVTNIMPVANVAHGVGATLGVLIGAAVTLPSYRRFGVAMVIAILLFGVWGATLGRPIVNLSDSAGFEEGQWGYDALLANQNEEAVRWLRDATHLQPQVPGYWFNLGIAYQRLGDLTAAKAAYERAHQVAPNDPEFAIPDSD